MVCVPRDNEDVLQVATPVAGATVCAEHPGMAAPVALSVKATDPVSVTPTGGNISVAVNMTGALMAELDDEEVTPRVVAASFTTCIGVSVALALPKLASPV